MCACTDFQKVFKVIQTKDSYSPINQCYIVFTIYIAYIRISFILEAHALETYNIINIKA